MNEMFRLRIAAKRQVTLPRRLLSALLLDEGDEIRLQVVDGHIKHAEACKLVPTRLFNKQVLEDLASRDKEIAAGHSAPLNIEALNRLEARVGAELEAAAEPSSVAQAGPALKL
jgi:bifunctional DNA-binding transcriptional regulator/antitoxin component of YhaV-PrlF toxin-antitoxin module